MPEAWGSSKMIMVWDQHRGCLTHWSQHSSTVTWTEGDFYVWYPLREKTNETQVNSAVWHFQSNPQRVATMLKSLSWTENWTDKETEGSKPLVMEKRTDLGNTQSSDHQGLRRGGARSWTRWAECLRPWDPEIDSLVLNLQWPLSSQGHYWNPLSLSCPMFSMGILHRDEDKNKYAVGGFLLFLPWIHFPLFSALLCAQETSLFRHHLTSGLPC